MKYLTEFKTVAEYIRKKRKIQKYKDLEEKRYKKESIKEGLRELRDLQEELKIIKSKRSLKR